MDANILKALQVLRTKIEYLAGRYSENSRVEIIDEETSSKMAVVPKQGSITRTQTGWTVGRYLAVLQSDEVDTRSIGTETRIDRLSSAGSKYSSVCFRQNRISVMFP
jgi:hypothetical protein